MISSSVSSSRSLLGSSASRIVGRLTSARAMTTRCCWPAESSRGSASVRWPRPTRSRSSRARAACVRGLLLAELERQGHVLLQRESRDEARELEDEAHGAVAQAAALGVADAPDVDAVHGHGAAGGRGQAGGDVEQRGLAAAGPAGDDQELAGLDVEVHVVQSGERSGVLAAVRLADSAQGDRRGLRCHSAHSLMETAGSSREARRAGTNAAAAATTSATSRPTTTRSDHAQRRTAAGW